VTRSNADAIAALNQSEILDGDMSPAEIVAALERLRFRNGLLPIRLDRDVRDFFVRIIETAP
jgi:hypothetical protein